MPLSAIDSPRRSRIDRLLRCRHYRRMENPPMNMVPNPMPHADLAPQPLDHARALHARYYTDAAIGALERRVVFDRGWQLVAHVCQLRNAGDHAIADFAGL